MIINLASDEESRILLYGKKKYNMFFNFVLRISLYCMSGVIGFFTTNYHHVLFNKTVDNIVKLYGSHHSLLLLHIDNISTITCLHSNCIHLESISKAVGFASASCPWNTSNILIVGSIVTRIVLIHAVSIDKM